MDKISIKDLEIYGYHGVNPEEKMMGQRFLVSLELCLDLEEAGSTDDLTKTVNYAELCWSVEEEFNKNKYDLIESAAEKLAEFILNKYKLVKSARVNIKKPWAPIGKPLKYASVEVERSWHTAYIALGSNLGDKNLNINEAINKIGELKDTFINKISGMYETKPVGYLDQDNFLNCAVEIKTLYSPKKLLEKLLDIEKDLKRERIIRWGPRTIDLDIIFYDNLVISSEELIVPHPRMQERLFVLKPLNDIAPFLVHPLLNKRIMNLLDEVSKVTEL
ncbi:2-amino-4-hydroxy-6-hydroxymethyldihydropteridine diphosphokinase [Clostridiales bacterium oral taxon 876 str. F0540]|nr:2-amino-4-hydroxy-6-hydroxymethyldihydropteridine diphosphokinase [Clostridiales bacterium oral taxon 876 str. F0540]